jgi:hypothetical protein
MAQLTLRRGDTRSWDLRFEDTAGTPISLVGATVWWTVRPFVPSDPGYDRPDTDAVIHAWWVHNGNIAVDSGVTGPDGTPGGSVVAQDAAGGILTITLLPALTTQLEAAPPGGTGPWRYDVQVMRGPDAIRTYDDGTLTVKPDVTRRTTTP